MLTWDAPLLHPITSSSTSLQQVQCVIRLSKSVFVNLPGWYMHGVASLWHLTRSQCVVRISTCVDGRKYLYKEEFWHPSSSTRANRRPTAFWVSSCVQARSRYRASRISLLWLESQVHCNEPENYCSRFCLRVGASKQAWEHASMRDQAWEHGRVRAVQISVATAVWWAHSSAQRALYFCAERAELKEHSNSVLQGSV